MNIKQQVALTLTSSVCLLWGILAAESLWLVLIPVWVLTIYHTRKLNSCESIRLQAVDLSLLIVGLSEIVLYFFSTYPANSSQFPLICLTFIFLWFCMRQWLIEAYQKHLILCILSAIGGVLAIFTLFFFLFYFVKVTEMGFDDITQFRYLYRPFGMFSNDWASIMLTFLPFATATCFSATKHYQRLSAVACLFISLSVIVSFSRGAIFCLIIFNLLVVGLLFYYRKYSVKQLVLGCCVWFVVLTLICIPLRAPLLTTLAITENTSQVRSIEGRINKWKDAGHLFLKYPVTGVGSGNFNLKSEPFNNQRESSSTGRSANSWFQLAAEKGMVGLFTYGLFLTFWIVGLSRELRLRQRNHFADVLCGAGLITCLLRETTFSTLFDKPSYLLLVVLLFWFSGRSGRTIQFHWRWVSIFIIPMICFGVLQIRQQKSLRNNKYFVRTYEKGEAVWEKLQKSLHLSPHIALLHANKGIYLLSQLQGYDSLVYLHSGIPYSTLFNAKNSFEQAVALNPSDASFQANLGILQIATGDSVSALQSLQHSLNLSPHQSIYHVLCGMAFSDDSIYSHQRFVHAIYYSPDIVDSQWFSDLYARDSILANSIVCDAIVMLSDSLIRRKFDPLLQACFAKLLLYQGRTDDAERLLSEVTQSMPNLNRPWLMLGDIAFSRNDTVALHYYERAMLLDPADVFAKIRTGDWYLNKQDSSKAFGYYIDALRISHISPTEHSRRSLSLYRTPTVNNDVVPPAFYRYIRPYVDTQKLANIIATGFEQEGNNKKAALYRQLARGEIGIREVMR